ncbi:unnamed protein product [Ceutorhynchus assimilis]|uniref:Ig-like domain-containing protein n=1 Tax=Ceutorhynchus assimilis TaxID=467358 RepID=A0A9N9MX65_9CUCU|nr:unnamed protein product [Ceutorhynchus assimilis]
MKTSTNVMNLSTSLQILFLLILFGSSSAKLHVTHQTEVKHEHEQFSVWCRAEPGTQLVWKGPKNRPLGEKTIPQARTTVHGVQLKFDDIRKADAGNYTCKSLTDNVNFELIVQTLDMNNLTPNTETPPRYERPRYNKKSYKKQYTTDPTVTYSYTTLTPNTTSAPIEFVDTPKHVTIKEGETQFLKCEARHATSTEWLVNGEPPPQGDKFKEVADGLWIYNVSPEDAENEYVCKAINSNSGTFLNRDIKLTVTHPPRDKFNIYEKQNIAYGYLNGIVKLTCEVYANPAPAFKWYKKTDRFKIIGKEIPGNSTNPAVSTLMIVLKEKKDFGGYRCEVKNSEGQLNIDFFVENGTQPEPPSYLELKDANSTALFLTIEEPAPDPENRTAMAPTGFVVEYRTYDDPYWSAQQFRLAEDKTYIVTNLTKNTTYQKPCYLGASLNNLSYFFLLVSTLAVVLL